MNEDLLFAIINSSDEFLSEYKKCTYFAIFYNRNNHFHYLEILLRINPDTNKINIKDKNIQFDNLTHKLRVSLHKIGNYLEFRSIPDNDFGWDYIRENYILSDNISLVYCAGLEYFTNVLCKKIVGLNPIY